MASSKFKLLLQLINQYFSCFYLLTNLEIAKMQLISTKHVRYQITSTTPTHEIFNTFFAIQIFN